MPMRIAHFENESQDKAKKNRKSKIDGDFIRDFLHDHNEKIRKKKAKEQNRKAPNKRG